MIIDRYLGVQLLVGTVLALVALLSILSLLDFMGEVDDIDAAYTLADVTRYIWLTTAGRVYELLPVAILIGGLLNLGSLAAQSELVALRAAGYSRVRIVFSVLGSGCVLAALVVLLGETLVPATNVAAAELRGDNERSGVFQKTGVGIWSREGERFIHVREKGDGNSYLDVSLYEFGDDHRLQRIVKSSAMQVESDRLVLSDAYEVRLGRHRLDIARSPQAVVRRVMELDRGALGSIAAVGLNTLALIRYIDFLKSSNLRRDFHEYMLWSRVSQPLSVLVMLLLALPFLFAPVRSSIGQRLFYGILIGLAYMLVGKLLGNAVLVFDFSPVIGSFGAPVLGLAAGIYHLSLYR